MNPYSNDNSKDEFNTSDTTLHFDKLLTTISKLEMEGNAPTPHISNKLRHIIQSSCNSIDVLINLFDCFQIALGRSNQPTTIDPNSLIGIYIRKYCLGFEELPFERIGDLWNSLCDYVYGSELDNNDDLFESSFCSAYQDEEDLIQDQYNIEKDTNTPFFPKSNSETSMADYNDYLTNLSNKERTGAIDSLHKYFDYAMIREQKTSPNAENHKLRMPFVSILLADLHYNFGESSFSIQATEEAIRVAHQSNDKECVAYALAWLHFNNISKNGLGLEGFHSEELLRKCAERSLDYNLVALYASAIFSLTRYYAHSNGSSSFNPALLWDSLSAASTRSYNSINSNNKTYYSSNTSNNEAYSTQITYTSNSKQTMTLLSKQHLLSSSIWEMIGHAPFTSLEAAIALHSHPYEEEHALSQQEFAIAIQKIIFSAFFGSCDLFTPSSLQTDTITFDLHTPSCLNTNNINTMDRRTKKKRSNESILSNNNMFQKCLMQLYDLKCKHSHSNDIWLHSVSLLLHQW